MSEYSLPSRPGVDRKSDMSVLQNTRLPAPIIAILAMLPPNECASRLRRLPYAAAWGALQGFKPQIMINVESVFTGRHKVEAAASRKIRDGKMNAAAFP